MAGENAFSLDNGRAGDYQGVFASRRASARPLPVGPLRRGSARACTLNRGIQRLLNGSSVSGPKTYLEGVTYAARQEDESFENAYASQPPSAASGQLRDLPDVRQEQAAARGLR